MNSITPILVAILTGGALSYLRDAIRWLRRRRAASTPEAIEDRRIHESVRQADESILVVARSRKALEDDNERLRETIREITERNARDRAEMIERHTRERAEWLEDRASLRGEIDDLEKRLQSALEDLRSFKERHGMTEHGG